MFGSRRGETRRGGRIARLLLNVRYAVQGEEHTMDSDAGNFYALVLGLMLTVFGGMAVCYGLVRLAEKAVQSFRARRVERVSVPAIRHAA